MQRTPVLGSNGQEHHRAQGCSGRGLSQRSPGWAMVGIMIITETTSTIQAGFLHGTSPAPPGSPVQERCGCTGSSVKDHEDGEGHRFCLLQGNAEKPEQFSLVRRRLRTSNLLYRQRGLPALSKRIFIETIQEEFRRDKDMKCHSNLEKLNLRTLNW